jgi:hypothetical protein
MSILEAFVYFMYLNLALTLCIELSGQAIGTVLVP